MSIDETSQETDPVFAALADHTRRKLLDRLFTRQGQTLKELISGLDMRRQSATRHLKVLESAGLVTCEWRGREKLHYLNPVPIAALQQRWIDKFSDAKAHALSALKHQLEDNPMSNADYVYELVINATQERIWEALTSASFTEQYWHRTRVQSTFEPGAPVEFLVGEDDAVGCEGEVLAAEPPRLLSYTWRFPRNPDTRDEAPSRVTFLLDPVGADGAATRLTVRHDQFPAGSKMPELIAPGWPLVIAGLKTLLETGEAVDFSMME